MAVLCHELTECEDYSEYKTCACDDAQVNMKLSYSSRFSSVMCTNALKLLIFSEVSLFEETFLKKAQIEL